MAFGRAVQTGGVNGGIDMEYAKFNGFGTETRLLSPLVLAGLLIGAMLPYYFSAMTMKSVGFAALEMGN